MTAHAIVEARVDDLWQKTKDHLAAVAWPSSIGNRVKLQTDTPDVPVENVVWGRVVVVPVETLFAVISLGIETRDIRFMVLVEYTMFSAGGLSLPTVMAVAQEKARIALDGWRPVLDKALLLEPIRLDRPAQAFPLPDQANRMWYTSAEYVCRVSAKPD
jgi:hypothetical protein